MLPANRFFLVFLCFFSITCAQKPTQGVSIDFLKPIHNKHTVAAGTGVLLFVVACCVGIQMNRLYKKIKRLKESVKEALQNLGHETDADTTEDALIALLPEQTKQLADKVDEKDKTNPYKKKYNDLRDTVQKALQNLGKRTDRLTEEELKKQLPEQTKQLASKLANQGNQHDKLLEEKQQHFLKKEKMYKESIQQLKIKNLEIEKKYNDLRDTVQKALQNLGKRTDRLTEEELKKQLPEQTKQLASKLANQGNQHDKLLEEKQHFLKKEKMYQQNSQQLKIKNEELKKQLSQQTKQPASELVNQGDQHNELLEEKERFLKREKMYQQKIKQLKAKNIAIEQKYEKWLDNKSKLLDRTVNENNRLKKMNMRLQVGERLQKHMNAIASEYLLQVDETDLDAVQIKNQDETTLDEFCDILDQAFQMRLSSKDKLSVKSSGFGERGFPRLQKHMNAIASEYLRAVSETDKSFVQIKNQNKTTPEEFSDILDQVTQIKLRDKKTLNLI